MRPRSLLIAAGLAALLTGGGYALARQGLQTCGWLDRLTGASGCLGSVRFEGVAPSRLNSSLPYGGQGQFLIASDILTADGWRTGLILIDPVSGRETGRYQVPMLYGDVQLFTAPDAGPGGDPDGGPILIACGVTVPRCGEDGGSALSAERGALQNFTAFPVSDPYVFAWPGTTVPDQEAYGNRAEFVAGGVRILADRRHEGLQLFDLDGTLVADLARQQFPMQIMSISRDGMRIASWGARSGASGDSDRIMIWDGMDGRMLAQIEGSRGGGCGPSLSGRRMARCCLRLDSQRVR
ncbi:hypothetical protein [Gemmobacter sp. 24YEA27]|uniref:hypothetical protein n=1 Tax=Gemmobacter sp. 24YEA27 TaxID=3040672 RepID=UPI0024B349EB|nr:hypothetical protein [Gemmobacter sp. 24YEA27]